MMQLDQANLRQSVSAAENSRPAGTVATHPPVVRIHELDGLRGILALFVVCYHMYGPLQVLHGLFADKMPILVQGWYPVDVFFLMSGFVMMHVYGKTFGNGTGWRAFGKFMRARVARLYPVHLAAMFVLLLGMLPVLYKAPELYSWEGRYSLGAFAGSLLMLHGPWIDYRSWNYPAWSISAEWHAYLIFPLLVPLAWRCRGIVAALLLAVCALIPFALYLQNLQPDPFPTNGPAVLLRVFPLFFGGMLLYRLNPVRWLASGAWAAVFVGATILVLFIAPLAPLAVLLAPALVLTALSPNWFQTVLRKPAFLFLGKISYSLYMTHALIEAFFVIVSQRLILHLLHIDIGASIAFSLAFWVVGVSLAVLLGYLTWRWVEEPARHWVMRITAPRVARTV